MIRVIVLAPIDNSLYARLVCHRLWQETGVQLAGIVVRTPWNLKRLVSEFNRDGSRLVRKIFDKWFIGDKRFSQDYQDNLALLAERWEMPFTSLKKLAAEHNIPYRAVSDHNSEKSRLFIEKLDPDLIVFTGGGLIRHDLLSIPKIGVLNCHTGILPHYRGMDVVEWTAAEGKIREIGFGATLHLMDNGVDTGPILLRTTIPDADLRNFEQIRAKIEVAMVEMVLQGVRGLRDETILPKPQDINAGKQYFVMHPRVQEYARLQLMKKTTA